MSYAGILARLRKEKGYTQQDVAEFISGHSEKPYSFKMVSHWENGVCMPPVEQFLLLCEFYGVDNIQKTFRAVTPEYRDLTKLNALGKSRVQEYIAMLSGNSLFSESEGDDHYDKPQRSIKLYDVPVAAGTGSFLDSDSYMDFEVDETVPKESDFAVRVSGDSMEPRFVDSQIVFIKHQQTLDIGELGIFELCGNAYIKKLGRGKLLSLNARYKPIEIREHDSFHIFGKVVG